jgi:glycosyltransferase involved in cell wall biosynthesis
MRVMYVITRGDDIGGAQMMVRDLAIGTRDRGHEVRVVTGIGGPLTQQLAGHGIESRICPGMLRDIDPRQDVRAVRAMTDLIREFQPDLVTTHSSKAGVVGRLAARRAGVPAMFTAHGWAFTGGVPQPKRTIYRLIERAMERFADRIVCVSDYDRQLAINAGMSPAKVVTIHNALNDIDPSLRARPDEGTPVRLVKIARFAEPKDHETLFRALTTLPDLEADLVGDGPGLDDARRLAEQLELGPRIHFLGQRTDVEQILARSNIFVLSSRWEGFPRSTLEAMRAGLPVVVSDVGGAGEAITDGVTGFLVAAGDREQLAERIRDLVRSPQLRREMGEAGRARYEREFTFDTMLDRTLALQAEIITRHGQPAN